MCNKLSGPRPGSHQQIASRQARESGSSLVELALLSSLFLLLLVGSVDLGQACYVAIEISAAANAGAQYGIQNPTNTAGMQKAALLSAANLSGATASASWGCECSDGSSASASCSVVPSCSVNIVKYVTVATGMMYKPPLAFPGVPYTLALKGSARLRADY
jgi:Flp pilus assembly protein TadG